MDPTKKASAAVTAQGPSTSQQLSYPPFAEKSSRIAKRRADMPKVYRGIYDRATTGQSRRAAVHAFCLECMGWQREEVRLCTSYACPLHPYRSYSNPESTDEAADFEPESTNDTGG